MRNDNPAPYPPMLCGMFKVSDIFLEPNPDLYFSTTLSLTCLESSLVFMVPLDWWCPLLSGVADSGDFQNRCTWDHVTLRLHTGGLYLTNYVTSEYNWLHQILFRGFIAKGVISYGRTTFPFLFCIIYFVFCKSFFKFHFTNLEYFGMSITW